MEAGEEEGEEGDGGSEEEDEEDEEEEEEEEPAFDPRKAHEAFILRALQGLTAAEASRWGCCLSGLNGV